MDGIYLVYKIKITTKDLGEIYTPSLLASYISRKTILYHLESELKRKFHENYHLYTDYLISLDRLGLKELKFIHDLLINIKILDPSCGEGQFLIESFKIICSIFFLLKDKGLESRDNNNITKSIMENNLFGVDISNIAVELCKDNLLSLVKGSNTFTDINPNIIQGDALIGTVPDADENHSVKLMYFNWNETFPEIIEKGGFDIIIANP
ncbi:MAG: Eco57I restriction-modification methylase domain-containing protein, partial [Candidatus Hodarchaeales archaeon]